MKPASIALGAAGPAWISVAAWPKPPPGADRQFKEWFEGLRQPGTKASCRSIADCRTASCRANGDNPTGNGVVCRMPPANIMCFVRTTEG